MALLFARKTAVFIKNVEILLIDGFKTFGWNVDKPAGSMFVWAEIPNGWTSIDFAYALMDRANVVVTPGHAFGPHGEGFVRIAPRSR